MPLIVPAFREREHQDELMDHPDTGQAEFEVALQDIQWVTRHLGGIRVLLQQVAAILNSQRQRRFRILVLGTGSADIPIALVEWAREQHIALELTAVDIHPFAVQSATRQALPYPEISVLQGDALHTGFEAGAFDVVISSMFMHHLDNDKAIQLLREMDRMSQLGLVINDLERHPMAWLGITLLGMLTGKGRLFRNDAPLSVRRGFTQEEAWQLVHQAGLTGAQVIGQSPFRLVIRQIKDGYERTWRNREVSAGHCRR